MKFFSFCALFFQKKVIQNHVDLLYLMHCMYYKEDTQSETNTHISLLPMAENTRSSFGLEHHFSTEMREKTPIQLHIPGCFAVTSWRFPSVSSSVRTLSVRAQRTAPLCLRSDAHNKGQRTAHSLSFHIKHTGYFLQPSTFISLITRETQLLTKKLTGLVYLRGTFLFFFEVSQTSEEKLT